MQVRKAMGTTAHIIDRIDVFLGINNGSKYMQKIPCDERHYHDQCGLAQVCPNKYSTKIIIKKQKQR